MCVPGCRMRMVECMKQPFRIKLMVNNVMTIDAIPDRQTLPADRLVFLPANPDHKTIQVISQPIVEDQVR